MSPSLNDFLAGRPEHLGEAKANICESILLLHSELAAGNLEGVFKFHWKDGCLYKSEKVIQIQAWTGNSVLERLS